MKARLFVFCMFVYHFLVADMTFAQWIQRTTQAQTGRGYYLDTTEGANVYAAVDNGLYFSPDNGTVWTSLGNPVFNGSITSVAVIGGIVFVNNSTALRSVYSTTNQGASWDTIGGTSLGGCSQFRVRTLLAKDTILFATGRCGLARRTTNVGATWVAASGGLPTDFQMLTLVGNGSTLLAGGNEGLYYSTNNGTIWFGASDLVNDTVNSISAASNGNSVLFAGTNRGLFRSTNGGVAWSLSSSSVPGTRILSLVSVNDDATVFAGTNGFGVYLTTNNGASWDSANTGLTSVRVHSLAISDTFLLAAVEATGGTANNGIWRRPLRQMGVTSVSTISNEIPNQFNLSQNYPNPFNPSTNIKCQIPNSNFVSLKVFDILGREVATLVNEQLRPGTYEVTFSADGLASGVYFYRLQVYPDRVGAGSFVQTRKLVLQK